ncbi:hypothetical protein SAMN05421766_102506 [Zobellia uliginosa]|uniref:RapA2 cadherin-like domain-containing protein n=1 Tax=Zobellia uliginosa TaxID=143224 RepID=A0ABY1KND3_9FLAO|nr:hypothetical protein [Zobellia uliginosa]SIS51408.1 hypothetical protein SAMN05421766_102506 [Zobellia uliginosa]
MNFSHPTSKRIALSLLSTLTLFSCSKDTELLESYLDASAPTNESPLGVNDFYKVGENGRITMDVLSNDRFSNPNNVKIIGVSEPKNGYVVINDDNTITYVLGDRSAQEEAEAAEAERKAREKEEAQAIQEQAELEAEKEAQEKAEAQAQAEREAQEKAEAGAQAQAEREAQEKAEAEAQAQAEREAQEKAEAEAQAQAEREAQEKAEAEAQAQAEREAQEKAEAEAKAQAEKEAQEKAAAEAAAQEEVDDSFTYTTETTDEEGNVVTEEVNVTVTTKAFSELKAFPTAEGFGKNATGGRGGIVVEVTNLNDSGPGSLRAALEMKQTRTIVFKVGGTINAKSSLNIKPGSGNVTIAGQTAPGGGILIKNGELSVQTDNVIIRHIRVRMGPGTNPEGGHNLDGIRVRSFQNNKLKDVIIDHCSVAWAIDENFDIKNAENVTIQNCIIGESIRGVLISRSKNISILNNLFILNNSRNVLANTVTHTDLTFEQINNIVYGFKWATSGTDGMSFNVISNSYKLPNNFDTSTKYPITLTPPDPENNDKGNIKTTHAYLKDNIFDSNFTGLYRKELEPYLFSSPKNKSSYKATNVNNLENKLLSHVGASIPKRDALDSRLISDFKNSNGTLRSNGSYPSISSGTAYKDSDKDGISDDWEKSHGLNPNNKADGNEDRNKDGYTNLEDFLYYLANK